MPSLFSLAHTKMFLWVAILLLCMKSVSFPEPQGGNCAFHCKVPCMFEPPLTSLKPALFFLKPCHSPLICLFYWLDLMGHTWYRMACHILRANQCGGISLWNLVGIGAKSAGIAWLLQKLLPSQHSPPGTYTPSVFLKWIIVHNFRVPAEGSAWPQPETWGNFHEEDIFKGVGKMWEDHHDNVLTLIANNRNVGPLHASWTKGGR